MADTANPIIKFYKVARWFVLAGLVLVIYLALKTPGNTGPQTDPAHQKEQAQAFQEKLGTLAAAHQQGSAVEVQVEAGEVNAAISESMNPAGGAAVAPQRAPENPAPTSGSNAAAGSAPSRPQQAGDGQIKDARVEFSDDVVTGYFTTQAYGRDVHLTVAGHLGSKNGYVTFEPTAFKIGELSVPVALVNPELQKKLAEPENREKLRLPEFVGDLRVKDGRLLIQER